jgi:hypothetical protein
MPIAVAFYDALNSSARSEELVYDDKFFWGTLIPHPDRSAERDRAITDWNNARIEAQLNEHVRPQLGQMGPDIITLMAQYSHHHY